MQEKNCFSELPEGYELALSVDAVKNKKFAVLMNVAAVLLMGASGALVWFLRFFWIGGGEMPEIRVPIDGIDPLWQVEVFLLVWVVSMIAYTFLHELTHGVVYKILTREKLTFGLALTCAYCGVPNVYVNRKTALLSLLAPFTVYSVLFLLLTFLAGGWVSALFMVLFAAHFGGCAGDLYVTFLLCTKFRRQDLLMNDTGPKQSFYIKK